MTVNTGTSILSGALACTITSNANACTIFGVRYSKAEAGVSLTATRSAGDNLPPGNSAAFSVVPVGGALRVSDIDGNNSQDALTDGLLLIRYLFGLRGQTLISGAIGPGATCTTSAQIEAYLQTLMP